MIEAGTPRLQLITTVGFASLNMEDPMLWLGCGLFFNSCIGCLALRMGMWEVLRLSDVRSLGYWWVLSSKGTVWDSLVLTGASCGKSPRLTPKSCIGFLSLLSSLPSAFVSTTVISTTRSQPPFHQSWAHAGNMPSNLWSWKLNKHLFFRVTQF